MKKAFTALLSIICLFFVMPVPALAKEKVPRLILKSFLPLPDNRLVAYGKVVYMKDRVPASGLVSLWLVWVCLFWASNADRLNFCHFVSFTGDHLPFSFL